MDEPLAPSVPAPNAALLALLTPREREAAALLARGAPYTAMARALGISHHTAHTYVQRIYLKARVSSQAALVALYWGVDPYERHADIAETGGAIAIERAPTWANHVRHARNC